MRLDRLAAGLRVLTVTLNASVDKRYVVSSFAPGSVSRVRDCTASAGGKGVNVARAAAIAGARVTATGFVAGHAGQFVVDGVRALGGEPRFVEVVGESRACVNLYDEATGTTTELLEPGPVLGADDLDRLADLLEELAADADVVALSGSLPRGLPVDTYARLVAVCRVAGAPVLLDTSGPALVAGLAARPSLVKPNADEVAALIDDDGARTTRTTATARALVVARALTEPAASTGTEQVVVSLGAAGALLVTADRALAATAPPVVAVNSVGCGDAMVAALALARAAGLAPEATLELAVAVGTAAAMTAGTAAYRPADVQALLDQVSVAAVDV